MLKKLIISGLAILLTLAAVEIGLRVTAEKRVEPVACRKPDVVLHHSFVANSECRFKTKEWDVKYQINSHGLRDNEHEYAKPAGVYRVLMVGDSFTEGYGVAIEDTFGKLLEGYVAQTVNPKFELINAGIASWSPTPAYVYLDQFGLKYQPDLVMLNLTISDFSDEYFYDRDMTSLGKQVLAGNTSQAIKPDMKLFNPSSYQPTQNQGALAETQIDVSLWEKLKGVLRDNLKIYRWLSLKVRLVLGLYNPITSVYPADIGKIESDQLAASREVEPVGYQAALTKIEANIYRIKRLLDANGVELMLVLVPHPHLVSGKEWVKGRKSFGLKPGKIYSDRGFRDLAAWADKVGIEAYDLTPYLKIEAAKQRLYFDNDGHFNAQGHQAVAQALLAVFSARSE